MEQHATTSATVSGVGDVLPNVSLPALDGSSYSLAQWRGKKVLLFFWGSWWGCREQLPGWQRFYDAHRDDAFALLSIALENLGAEAARPFVAAAGATFPTLIDEHGLMSDRLGFKVVPNGLLVDERGVIRYAKYGGFSIDEPADVAAVEQFLAGETLDADLGSPPPYVLSPVERELVATKLQLGRLLDAGGQRAEAVATWRSALRFDPENLTIRKQIWLAEHPEKFHPTIDWDWQRGQLQQEREAEIAQGVCGPDGCPIRTDNVTR
jgi:peroxiredoxin